MDATLPRFWLYAAVFLTMSLGGCMKVGPDFKRPDAAGYAAWQEGYTDGLNARLPL